jgi:hypothetical protein
MGTSAQDTGYQGYNPEGVKIIQPTKKPKGNKTYTGTNS